MARHSHNWKGGRSIASNGYVLIYVGKAHHLADVPGYAYEHRIVAEQKLGRPLRKGEVPHHVNSVRDDNRAENIEVVESQFAHRVKHRMAKASTRQQPHEENPFITCACGCGELFATFDSDGRPRRFVTGHNPPDAPTESAVLAALDRPRARADIASRIGKPMRATASALSKMKHKGLIRQVVRGVWEKAS